MTILYKRYSLKLPVTVYLKITDTFKFFNELYEFLKIRKIRKPFRVHTIWDITKQDSYQILEPEYASGSAVSL